MVKLLDAIACGALIWFVFAFTSYLLGLNSMQPAKTALGIVLLMIILEITWIVLKAGLDELSK